MVSIIQNDALRCAALVREQDGVPKHGVRYGEHGGVLCPPI